MTGVDLVVQVVHVGEMKMTKRNEITGVEHQINFDDEYTTLVVDTTNNTKSRLDFLKEIISIHQFNVEYNTKFKN